MDRCRWTRVTQPGGWSMGAGAGEDDAPPRPAQRAGDGFRLDAVPGIGDLDPSAPLEAALYELLRREDEVWRLGFPAYLRHRHEAGPAGGGHLTGPRLTSHLALAGDARVLRKTRAVMEAAHCGRALSLAELARAGDAPVEDRRKREVGLRERVLWPMDELGVWDVSEVLRAHRPGARGVSRYEIRAGPALVAFDAPHYRPWLSRQLEHLAAVFDLPHPHRTRAAGRMAHGRRPWRTRTDEGDAADGTSPSLPLSGAASRGSSIVGVDRAGGGDAGRTSRREKDERCKTR